jgi:hypothetical protein
MHEKERSIIMEKSKNHAKIEWRKRQRVLAVTLSPEKDKDIIDFIDSSGVPAATLAKQVFRAYIAMQNALKGKGDD